MRAVIAAVLTFALALVTSGADAQAKKVVIKLGHLQATDSAIHLGAQKLADLVSQKTGGQAEVQIFPNSQLGNAKSQLQAVSI